MDYRFEKFDPQTIKDERLEQLRQLFNQLLMRTGGDVEEALDWMQRLWEYHNFFDGEVSFGEFKEYLEEKGYLEQDEDGYLEITQKGDFSLRSDALLEIFSSLKKDALGDHRTDHSGIGFDVLPETRPFEFGDRVNDIHYTESIKNAIINHGIENFTVGQDDLVVYEKEHQTSCATAVLIDISHSMTLYGEDRITPAKQVAMALQQMIRSRFPKDSVDVIAFGDEAFLIDPSEVPYLQNGPYHTNTHAALQLAQQVLLSRRHSNRQIFMITDGKPTQIIEDDGQVYRNTFQLDPRIINPTINEAVRCRRREIDITTFMIASDPYLREFIEELTAANQGKAYYSSLDRLGEFVFADFAKNRRKRFQG
ncbi:MAG: VWA domain-containing protein [Candidatus Omnitrophica bacterium]|nr:VWA domain-containing protein [Candidatus Omnitrophota bacterium]MCA9431509.1 VWA domain-containing protein [Candidatus Omnitrophota bacterium]